VKREPLVFTRHRIEWQDVEGDAVVISRGPAAGSEIVVAGAAELFGTEFGIGK